MKLALIGGGMVGRCYGQAFAAQGVALCGIWDAQPSDDLRAFAQQHGTPLHTGVGDWLGEAEVVISAVFGSAALDVATAAMPHLRTGALYIDMTTADPEDMRRAQALASQAGHHFIDVAITGAVNLHGARTPLLCAGTHAPQVAELFRTLGAPIQVVGTQPGDAASLKLLRSIFTKGLEALSVECLLTAERQGLRAQLHDILGDIDQTSLKLLMESMVQTHIEHSARRQKEVAEAQRQMQQVGIRPLVLPAVEALFQRTAERQAHTPFKGQGIDAALEWLDASAR